MELIITFFCWLVSALSFKGLTASTTTSQGTIESSAISKGGNSGRLNYMKLKSFITTHIIIWLCKQNTGSHVTNTNQVLLLFWI